jgi:O-acetyl-ADP-ribose deacetylase (regulator of RNase III)
LFNAICKAGGDSLKASFNTETNKNPEAPVVAVKAKGKLSSKVVYFLPWKINSDTSLLRKSIQKFVSDAMEKAATDKYQSIAFPVIGCGRYGCPISLVAKAMIEEAHRHAQKHGILVLFVIQPEKTDIYDEFQKQINFSQQPSRPSGATKTISTAVNKGIIEVEQGDITTQKVYKRSFLCLSMTFFFFVLDR